MATAPTDESAPATGDGHGTAPKPTTLVLVRHAVTPQTGPMLSGRAPGIDLSELQPRETEIGTRPPVERLFAHARLERLGGAVEVARTVRVEPHPVLERRVCRRAL